jgi:hypothetical protein
MKFLKKIAVSLVMTASMLAVSSSAYSAEEHKDKNAVVLNAAKLTEEKMLEAKSMLEKGGFDSEQIQQAMNDARQAQKEFRYEATERTRQKLQEKLKTARESFLKNDSEKALADLNAGLAILAEMRKVYDAAH